MVLWTHSKELVEYPIALERMRKRIELLKSGKESEEVWLLEHPPLYTAGTSANPKDLLTPNILPVFETGRGGQFTYHGPGQRIAYVMIDLKQRDQDLRKYVWSLEEWVIDSLKSFNIEGERREGRIGIWVITPHGEKKIAAIGVRISQWITYHGIAINVSPNLNHYSGIIPCGISEYGVTSLHQLGMNITLEELDQALKIAWEKNSFLSKFLSP